MHKDELPYWLQSLIIVGREGDEDKDENQDEGDEGDDENEDDYDEGEEGKDKSKDDQDDSDLDAKVAALEKALGDERRLRRKAERDAKRNARKKTSEKNKEEEADTQKQLQAAQEKTQRLADGFKNRAVDSAIEKEARRQGFIDPTDALLDDIRRKIDVDQDEEDPSDIDIDMDSVKDAVQDLANRKKHLVGKATPSEPSGSKFRKKGSASDKPDSQALQEHYPSLR